jgi:long-subunit acyl-CoA synthetase (AMP-forming)
VFGPALGIGTGLADNDVTSPGTLTPRRSATPSHGDVVFVAARNGAYCDRLAAVRLVMSAGAPVPIETLRAMARLCPHASLHTPYGMTEILPVADISLATRIAVGAGRGVCVGPPVAGCQVMIDSVDQSLPGQPLPEQSLPVGQTGEVVVTARWMSAGYDRLWLTQQLARPVAGAGGSAVTWHRTGDIGHLDEHGNLWIEGRVVHLVHTTDGAVAPGCSRSSVMVRFFRRNRSR